MKVSVGRLDHAPSVDHDRGLDTRASLLYRFAGGLDVLRCEVGASRPSTENNVDIL